MGMASIGPVYRDARGCLQMVATAFGPGRVGVRWSLVDAEE